MKQIKFLSLFLFLSAGALVSCNSDDNTDQSSPNASVTANVNGSPLRFNNISTDVTGQLLMVHAVSEDLQHSLQLVVDKDIEPGTYTTYTDAMEGSFMRYMYQSSHFESETGTLIITSNNGQWLDGSFYFEGPVSEGGTGHLTEGQLHVRY